MNPKLQTWLYHCPTCYLVYMVQEGETATLVLKGCTNGHGHTVPELISAITTEKLTEVR